MKEILFYTRAGWLTWLSGEGASLADVCQPEPNIFPFLLLVGEGTIQGYYINEKHTVPHGFITTTPRCPEQRYPAGK